MSGLLDDEELQRIYQWVDEVPLSRPKRNIARDFADGVLVAENVSHYFPRLVELVSALDDLLDRGEYDDLDVQEATEYARVVVRQKRESEAAAANAATEALTMPAP